MCCLGHTLFLPVHGLRGRYWLRVSRVSDDARGGQVFAHGVADRSEDVLWWWSISTADDGREFRRVKLSDWLRLSGLRR